MRKLPISVIIPTHSRTTDLRELLGSLERQNKRVDFEVLVIANLPEPGLKKVVESYGPRFRFLETGRIGANIARNKGLERARGEILVFFDDDSYVPDKGFLEQVWKLHELHPQAFAIGGPYMLRSGASVCEAAYHAILSHRIRSSLRRYNESTLLLGGNWSCKTVLADEKFRFDDGLIFGGADVELFARMRTRGSSFIFEESIPVIHRPRVNVWSLAKRAYLQGLVFGKMSRASDGLKHWNSTMSVQECATSEGLRWTRKVSFFVSFYEKIFSFAATTASRSPESAPDFSIGRIFASFFPDFSTSARRRFIGEVSTLVQNAVIVAKDKELNRETPP